MDEPPLTHSALGVAYYEKMMAERRHIGRPEFFNAAGHVLACPGRSTDHVYLFLHVEGSVVKKAGWQCHMCDPWMQIAADIVCGLIEGRRTAQILGLKLPEFEAKLGGEDYVIAHHTGAAALVAYKAALDYEVKETLKRDQEGKISPKSLLKDLGYTGREGMLRIKKLAEGRFAVESLSIPRARLESVCSKGAVQDFSTLVQDILERRAIDIAKANGLGFPRSFDDALDAMDKCREGEPEA